MQYQEYLNKDLTRVLITVPQSNNSSYHVNNSVQEIICRGISKIDITNAVMIIY